MNAGAIRAGRAFVELNADSSKFTRALRQAEGRLKRFGSRVQEIGRGMLRMGALSAAPLAISTKLFASFDDQMRAVKAITRATGRDFEMLTDKAKYLGRTTSFTASQVAGAMVELGRMGFSPTEIDASIQGILDLARATGTDLSESALIASGTLRAFNLDAGKMSDVVDILTATANNSAQTLTDLGESMKYAAPVAAEFGMTLQETAKALGTMAQFTIKGSMAGTTMRNIMLRMANPAIQKTLKGLGVSASDQEGNIRPLADILTDIGAALSKVKPIERIGLLDQIFGARAVTGGSKLTKESFEQLNNAIDNFAGTARQTAAEMDSGIGGAFRRLWSAVEGTALAVGDKLAPPISTVSDKLSDLNGVITKWIDHHTILVRVVGLSAAGLIVAGAALMAFGIGITFIGKAIGAVLFPLSAALGAVKMLTGAAIFLSNPFVAAAAVIGSFGLVLANAAGTTEEAIRFIADKLTDLREKYGAAFEAFREALLSGDVSRAAKIFWLSLKLAWASGISGLLKEWHGLWKNIRQKASDMWTGVVSGWHMAVRGIKEGIARLKLTLEGLWAGSKKGFKDMYADWTYWLGWYYADLRGMLDEDFDVNAMKWAMHDSTQAGKSEARQAYLDEMKAAQDEFSSRSKAINSEFTDNLKKTLEDGSKRQKEINDRYLQRMAALKKDIERARANLHAELAPQKQAGKQQQEAQDRINAARKRLAKAEAALRQSRDRSTMEKELQVAGDPKERQRIKMARLLSEKEAALEYRNAQKELRDAVAARRETGPSVEGGRIRQRRTPSDLMKDSVEGILKLKTAKLAGISLMQANAAGSFSGFARFGMQGDSTSQRMASGIEEIARNTREMLNETRDSDEEIV